MSVSESVSSLREPRSLAVYEGGAPSMLNSVSRRVLRNRITKLVASTLFVIGCTAISANAQSISVNGVSVPNSVTTAAGTRVTVAVSDGPAQASDWVGLYPVSTENDAWYLDKQFLNGAQSPPSVGQANATLSFLLPTTAGSYEFRLFSANTRLVKSTTVVVSASSAALSINGSAPPASITVAAGSRLTIDVSDGPANARDMLFLYPAGGSA